MGDHGESEEDSVRREALEQLTGAGWGLKEEGGYPTGETHRLRRNPQSAPRRDSGRQNAHSRFNGWH
jgi:hypothetical protein